MLKSIIAFFSFLITMIFQPNYVDFTYSVQFMPLNISQNAYAYMNGSNLIVEHIFFYSCGANITINITKNDNTLKIYEENVGEILRCPVVIKLNIIISNPGNVNKVEIYGIKYKNIYNYTLLHSLKVNRTYVECHSDKDCVHQSACCHQKAMQCIPKDQYKPLNPKKCLKVMCTMECKPCIKCKCIDGTCESVPKGGCC